MKRGELEGMIKSLRDEPPHDFICPITHHIMRDPVIAPGNVGLFSSYVTLM